MINCTFEDNKQVLLRHVTLSNILQVDGKVLLIKRTAQSLTEPNKYALPGGYLDRDETPTEGALRELLEETGYQASSAKLFRVIGNPNRKGNDRQDLELSFIVDSAKKIAEPDMEVSEVKWFDVNELPEMENFAFDHHDTLQLYIDYLKQNFKIPVFDL